MTEIGRILGEIEAEGMDRCGVTGKERFNSKQEAQASLGGRPGMRAKQVHYCIFCSGYHKTKNQRGKPMRRK